MILTTHGIAGATTMALLSSHPALGLLAAFGSHFVLDSFPHWDYSIQSLRTDVGNSSEEGEFVIGPGSLVDFIKIGIDFSCGIVLSIIFLALSLPTMSGFWLIIGGALAGMFPDLLQFIYFRSKSRLLLPIQRFHDWSHSKTKIRYRPLLGVFLQVIVIAVILIFYYS
jgi:hypothetical protein